MAKRSAGSEQMPGWDPASWRPYLPDLEAGDHTRLDIEGLLATGLLQPLFDGRYVPLPLLLDGIVLTHRVSAAEVAGGFLDLYPDLDPLTEPLRDGLPLAGGGTLRAATLPEVEQLGLERLRSVLLGAASVLASVAPGEHIAVRMIDATIEIARPVDVPPPGGAAARQLRRTTDTLLRSLPKHVPVPAVTVRDIVWAVCMEDPDRWACAEAPLSDQLTAAGLATEHGWVAAAGADLTRYAPVPPPHVSAVELAALLDEPGLDSGALALLDCAVSQARVGGLDPRPAVRARLAALLAQPQAVWALTLLCGNDPGLEPFCHALAPAVDRAGRAVVETLLARGAGRRGDLGEMCRRIDAALAADPDCREARRDAARLAEDRGDAGLALDHLEAAAADPDERAVIRLRGFAGRVDVPLEERVEWLWHKAADFTCQPRFADTLRDVAQAWFGHEPDWADASIGDLVVAEFVLFDGGLLETFLAERGDLLPEDERDLASEWIGAPWRLMRAEGIGRGILHARDETTGGRCRVKLAEGSTVLAGARLLGHVLGNGTGSWLGYGAAHVPEFAADGVAALLAEGASGAELAGHLASAYDRAASGVAFS